ncbi:hypothetical protein CLV35_0228 [Motilibacter peucedani]|uniref:DUF6545 domain-containing protein n=1 Tax=Motilibacter peucedani TaxID=598650 RepID=A0A420XVF5_9ACTN|nr:MAB_1171c family putative transporter [Motilibacter peucedani]RKS80639.1 hypothetical protein CLV35_0228 [Motilibacter peucedani]
MRYAEHLAGDLPPIIICACALYRVPSTLRRDATPALRALGGLIFWLAAGMTLLSPPVYRLVDRTLHVPNISALLGEAAGLILVWPGRNMLLYEEHPVEKARAISRRRYWGLPPMLLLSLGMWWISRGPTSDPAYLVHSGTSPAAVGYLCVARSGVIVGALDCFRWCLHYSRRTQADLRVGLAAMSFAGGLALLMVTYESTYYVAGLVGRDLAPWGSAELIMRGIIGVSTSMLALGLALPTWWTRSGTALRRWRALRDLRPLWVDVTAAVPTVVRPVSRWSPELALHRRVVEIRDAQLALRRHAQPLAPAALAVARERGLDDEVQQAFVEATVTAGAVLAKRAGLESRSASGSLAVVHGGASLQDETAWLVQVAQQYAEAKALASARLSLADHPEPQPAR